VTNWKLNKVSLCQKSLVNVVSWWSYAILIVASRFFFETQCIQGGAVNRKRGMTVHGVQNRQDNSVKEASNTTIDSWRDSSKFSTRRSSIMHRLLSLHRRPRSSPCGATSRCWKASRTFGSWRDRRRVASVGAKKSPLMLRFGSPIPEIYIPNANLH